MAASATSNPASAPPIVAGIPISHPDRLIYPELSLTKHALARYYEQVGARMLPHVAGRPLTLLHCPTGVGGECRYMRHSKVWGPAVLRRVRIQEQRKRGEYLVADSVAAIVALVQMGVVEIHTWNSTTARVEQPDRIVWDLDPGPQVAWAEVAGAARLLRSVLDVLGLDAWVKTSGGNGLHVVVPIAPTRDWSECLAFARGVAVALERSAPLFTTAFARQGREARILIDYLRNNRTNTSVAAFSTRARPGAPVSMPMAWTDLRRQPTLTIVTAVQRLSRQRRDPWHDYWRSTQQISDRMLRAVRSL